MLLAALETSAAQDADFIAVSGRLSLPAGSTGTSFAVRVVGDMIDEADQTVLLTLTTSTPADAQVINSPAILTIQDNDEAGLNLSPDAAPLIEGETATYQVSLNSEPIAPVIITLSADSQIMVVPSTLVFTPSTWAVSQTVLITALDDNVVELPVVSTVAHTLTSDDPVYKAWPSDTFQVSIRDNDVAVLSIDDVILPEATAAATGSSPGRSRSRIRCRGRSIIRRMMIARWRAAITSLSSAHGPLHRCNNADDYCDRDRGYVLGERGDVGATS
ncbi:hypothetical protein HC891_09880 [Candidatus Gracilibacteria bacterium]|nr:hypothetical protein [Candidatus Gracilibacteria bacterium]